MRTILFKNGGHDEGGMEDEEDQGEDLPPLFGSCGGLSLTRACPSEIKAARAREICKTKCGGREGDGGLG